MENLSANQRFKISGSKLPFKEWLKMQTLEGSLIDYKNADGDAESELENIASVKKEDNTMTIVLVGVLALGLYVYYTKKK